MQVKIEDYRGFEITFDTGQEKFLAISGEHDTYIDKPSFASAKKWVDEFIKENAFFKEFTAIPLPGSYSTKGKFKVIGIRKDGRFVAEDKNGEKYQFSEYSLRDYMVEKESNNELLDKYNSIETDRKNYNLIAENSKKELIDKMDIVTLKDYKLTLCK